MATHSSTLAWKIPWMEEPGGLQSMGSLRVGMTEQLHFQFSLSCIEEGNGNPLQCSCLENPRNREAWWAAVYGVAQSRTRLKWLSSSSSSSRDIQTLGWNGLVFQRYKLPKLAQEETDNLKSPISINKIKVVVINFPSRWKKAVNSGWKKGYPS